MSLNKSYSFKGMLISFRQWADGARKNRGIALVLGLTIDRLE